jgi:Flp pilus assembly pilin Flp
MVAALWSDDSGTIPVEHALLIALLVILAISAWTLFGGQIRTTVSRGTSALASLMPGASGSGAAPGALPTADYAR